MASASNDNFGSCYTAIETVLLWIRPCLQHVLETWHQQTMKKIQPCLSPDQCPRNQKPTTENKACQSCLEWVAAIQDVVYPPSDIESLYWSNVNPTLFSKNPIEIIKLFTDHHTPNQAYLNLGEVDNTSLLVLMSKFKEFHRGDHTVFGNIQQVYNVLPRFDLD